MTSRELKRSGTSGFLANWGICAFVTVFFGLLLLVSFPREAKSEPSWARKYNAQCTLCHTIYPRLNRTGYVFKRLGYRFPSELVRNLQKNGPPSASGGPAATSRAYVPAAMTPAAESGRRLYDSASCSTCHSIARQGGDAGPALDGVGVRRTREWLLGHIANPQEHVAKYPKQHEIKTSMMPAAELTPSDVAQIVEYLLTLPAAQGEARSLEHRNRPQDYFAAAYLPAAEMERSMGESKDSFVSRELNLYIAGTLGPNFSLFVQPTPAADTQGLWNHFEMIEGLYNYGNADNFLQIRYGQIFNLLNAGFAGTDRTTGETIPLIFESANGFNPRELGRGVSVEYTMKGLTTFKVFGNYQTPPEFGVDNAPEAGRSRTYGFAFEKVIGSRGLSGVQFQFAGGYTPLSLEGQVFPALRFQRYSVFANKTFLDKRNVERLNLISGVSFLRDNRLLESVTPEESRGYGYFLETDWIPVRRLDVVGRFDQLRPTTLFGNNTARAESAQVLYDFAKYVRMSFEYQHRERSLPTNLYRLAWQLNF